MIQLTLQWIKNLAGNDRKFKSGFMIHQRDLITSIEASSKNGFKIHLSDLDNNSYKLYLYFYKDTGTFKLSKCSCHDSQPCVHTIASLLYILYKKERLTIELTNNHTLKMFESFGDILLKDISSIQKQYLQLELTLYPKDVFSQSSQSSIMLKVGFIQVYLVKNIENFVCAVISQKSYEVSKTFSFDPKLHAFSPSDYKTIELIYDFYYTRTYLLPSQQSFVATPIKASSQNLPASYIKRLLALLKSHTLSLNYDDLLFKNQLINQALEIDFYVSDENSHYMVSVNNHDIFFPLTEDFTYVFYNNQISFLNKQTSEAFKLFYHYFINKNIDISLDQLDEFINRILPVLQMIGYVTIEPDILNKVVFHPLKATIYIDNYHNQTALTVSFEYGSHKYLVYPEQEPILNHIILSRQIDKEKQILALLKSIPNSQLEDGRLTYDSEEHLFYFIDQILPKLQNLADVYYSDDFKETHMKAKKHLITSINYNKGLNLLDLNFDMEGVSKQELNKLFNAIIEKKHYFKLSDGSFFAINDHLSNQMLTLTKRFDINLEDNQEPLLQVDGYHAFYLDSILTQDNQRSNYNDPYNQLLHSIKYPEKTNIKIPKELDPILRDYQKTGYRWLKSLTSYGLSGILADDMGLGKTIQAITLITSQTATLPSLIVAPTSLLYNWVEEFQKFAPHKKTVVITGNKIERKKLIEAINQDDIIITSYGALKRDLPQYESPFMYFIIDEAQHIKNPKSLNAIAIKKINAKYRFALTGTPIENTLTELWSIFDFILPGFLGTHQSFMKNYERPIIKNNDQKILKQLSQMITPFILRRLKDDVLTELPPKIETKISVELNKHQKKLYMAYVQQAKSEIHASSALPKGQKTMKVLAILTRLRQICCHPSLFVDNYTHNSSKMELLLELITDSLESGHRILLFSQFTSMLDMIQDMLIKNKIELFYLDGSVPPSKRQQMVHDFNGGLKQVFLISLKAGGTGLNLTGADVVIHYDPWWNPAVENQATDRAYRIGQKKCVQVYKLITAGTIEEKIYELQRKKQGLIENVIRPGETFINKLSTEELQTLFM